VATSHNAARPGPTRLTVTSQNRGETRESRSNRPYEVERQKELGGGAVGLTGPITP